MHPLRPDANRIEAHHRPPSDQPGGKAVKVPGGDQRREYDIAEIAGPYTWDILHHVVSRFPCAPCAREGSKLLRGLHDLVNVKIGKPLFAPADFRYLVQMVHDYEGRLDHEGPADNMGRIEAEVRRLARAAGLLRSQSGQSCGKADVSCLAEFPRCSGPPLVCKSK